MAEPEIVSDETISTVDTFAMSRCYEFLANRATDLDTTASSFEKTFGSLTSAWSSPAAQPFMDAYARVIKVLKDQPEILRKLSSNLKDTTERHGTATKRAESIASEVELPVWPEEIV